MPRRAECGKGIICLQRLIAGMRADPVGVQLSSAAQSTYLGAHVRPPAGTRYKAVIPEKKDQAANRKKKGSRGGRPVSHDADL
ncbi:hypothetical protein AB0392_44235, partial [Nonomuraea angiospora]